MERTVTYPITLQKLREMVVHQKLMYNDITVEKFREYIADMMYGKQQTRQIRIWPMGPGAQKALDDAMREELRQRL